MPFGRPVVEVVRPDEADACAGAEWQARRQPNRLPSRRPSLGSSANNVGIVANRRAAWLCGAYRKLLHMNDLKVNYELASSLLWWPRRR